ncbi:MAG: DUF4249 domain-containing protein [Rhodothermia bacterium]|nr:DUF4249 domain-containing protein [Rhodothermia bacterium]
MAIALWGGCETVVDVTPPRFEQQLVAHGLFSQDSVWVVRVSKSVAFTSPEKPGFVEDATVQIFRGDELIAEPARVDTGTYATTGVLPQEGVAYRMKVSAPGLGSVEGSDVLPQPPAVLDVRETVSREPDEASRLRRTTVEIVVDDPSGTDNYYGLLLVQARVSVDRMTGAVTPLPPSIFPFESDNLAFGESDFAFIDTEKTLYREAFFTDGLFDGTQYTFDLDIVYEDPDPSASVVIHRAFAVAVLSLSEDFFTYWKTAGDQAFSNENPFAEPLRVYSNISGGLGVFGAFQYQMLPLSTGTETFAGVTLADLCGLSGISLPFCPTAGLP